MIKIFILLFSIVASFSSLAKEERITIEDNEGHRSSIGIESYRNSNGVFEVRVDAAGIPKFLDRLNPTIAYGRDLDDNKKIDTWFFITENGIEVEQLEGNDPLGRDVLPQLIFKKYKTSAKLYLSFSTTTVLSYVLMSANEIKNTEIQYYQDWMNLEEIRIRFEREMKTPGNSLTKDQIQFHYELMSFGYKHMAEYMDSFSKKEIWGWVSADAVLWFSGAAIFRLAGKLFIKSGEVLAQNGMINAVKNKVGLYFEKQKSLLDAKVEKISEKLYPFKNKLSAAKKESVFRLTKFNLQMAINSTLISSVAKSRLLNAAKIAVKWPSRIIIGAKSEWEYIAMNMGIQAAAETSARWDEVYDPNPLILAKNVLTNPDIEQNIGFMTADTILMTGISKNLSTTKARFIASGFIGMTDSTMINLVIKQEDDYKRVAMDTGWEAIVGNAQVQIDLKALETFEKMAQKNNNPKLKLIGYALAVVDQGVGYYVYSKVSSDTSTDTDKNTDKNKNLNLKLVPIMAEHS